MAAEIDSVALVASQNESLSRQEPAERLKDERPDTGVSGGHLPVFEAFNELGLSGRDIAHVASVTPPTVSKWRQGKVRIPGDRLAFLTLVLAHLLDDAEALAALEAEWSSGGNGGDWCRVERARTDAARAHLALQDVLNRGLDVSDVRDGARNFRDWWASGAAKLLQEKRFRLALDGSATRDIETIKARIARP